MDLTGCKGAMKKGTDNISPDGSPLTLNDNPASSSPKEVPIKGVSESPPVTSTAQDHYLATQETETSVESLLDRLELAERSPARMFTAVGAIFQQATLHEPTVDPGGTGYWRETLERAEESGWRGLVDVDALKLVRNILDYLWLNGPEEELVHAATVLADASRETRWRIPFRQGGILDFFLEVIATDDVDPDLNLVTLRLIGNACADEDTNRESVVSQGYILPIINQLQNESLANLTIPVLYNICIDYEPAQEAVRNNLFGPLIDLLAKESFQNGPLLNYICPLLSFSIEQLDPNQSPDNSVHVLLKVALGPEVEVDDLVPLVNAIVIHLQLDRFQRMLIAEDLVKLPLVMIIRSFAPQTPSDASLSIFDLMPEVRDLGAEEKSFSVRSALIRAMSDVSANSEFGVKYPVDSELVKSLLLWLSASRPQFQICSCIMLGNLARSDIVCYRMVHDLRVHGLLAAAVQDSSDLQVLHAALGFLRNLALPLENKSLLGEAHVIDAISRFWSMDLNPQLQYSAVSLVRQLLNNSLVNVQRLLASLSDDPDSPAHEKTYLSLLLSLFDETGQVPTRVEIARTMAAIWRCLNTPDPSINPNVISNLQHRIFSRHANIARPLALMVIQTRWPIVRSEGWFALALMARSREGSAAVNIILQQVEVFAALVETLTGQSIAPPTPGATEPVETGLSSIEATAPSSGPSGPITTRSDRAALGEPGTIDARNRENAMILINELLRHSGDDMSLIRRNVLEDLLRGRQSSLEFQELMLRAQSLE